MQWTGRHRWDETASITGSAAVEELVWTISLCSAVCLTHTNIRWSESPSTIQLIHLHSFLSTARWGFVLGCIYFAMITVASVVWAVCSSESLSWLSVLCEESFSAVCSSRCGCGLLAAQAAVRLLFILLLAGTGARLSLGVSPALAPSLSDSAVASWFPVGTISLLPRAAWRSFGSMFSTSGVLVSSSSRGVSCTCRAWETKEHLSYSTYVSIQSYKLNLCANLEYHIRPLRIKHCFHPVSWKEQNRHFLNSLQLISWRKIKFASVGEGTV